MPDDLEAKPLVESHIAVDVSFQIRGGSLPVDELQERHEQLASHSSTLVLGMHADWTYMPVEFLRVMPRPAVREPQSSGQRSPHSANHPGRAEKSFGQTQLTPQPLSSMEDAELPDPDGGAHDPLRPRAVAACENECVGVVSEREAKYVACRVQIMLPEWADLDVQVFQASSTIDHLGLIDAGP